MTVLGLGPRPVLSHLPILLSTSSWGLCAVAPRGRLPAESVEAWKQKRRGRGEDRAGAVRGGLRWLERRGKVHWGRVGS